MRTLAFLCASVILTNQLALADHPDRGSRNRSAQQPGTWSGVERIVAIGDVHGDYDQLVAVLKTAGLIDDQLNWTGGKTHLVQNGDVLDRGPDSRKAMDLLMRLEKQAADAGGYVHALIGNHEAMNVFGDFRYTSKGEFAAFVDENSEKHPADPAHPPGYAEHQKQFSPDGYYGKWIVTHDTVIKINDSLFLHAGISAKYMSTKIRDINERVREELTGDPAKLAGGIVKDGDGPLWYRGLAQGDATLEPLVDKIRKNFGVERIVLGHTYADAAITPRFDGKVILVDIGLSRVYDGIGKVGCLVIEGEKVYVLHRGTRLELPTDSGKDLLRYLKQAAALDPPPSPLVKRIAELESQLGAGAGAK
ncbi:MAG: metallophosphoesterase [Acidobacteriia bacterium]|nr:metallophosphoesterase [Terriglobia bacterium]